MTEMERVYRHRLADWEISWLYCTDENEEIHAVEVAERQAAPGCDTVRPRVGGRSYRQAGRLCLSGAADSGGHPLDDPNEHAGHILAALARQHRPRFLAEPVASDTWICSSVSRGVKGTAVERRKSDYQFRLNARWLRTSAGHQLRPGSAGQLTFRASHRPGAGHARHLRAPP